MTDFCKSCGFLLPLDLIHNRSSLCTGCRNLLTSRSDPSCCCIFCKNLDSCQTSLDSQNNSSRYTATAFVVKESKGKEERSRSSSKSKSNKKKSKKETQVCEDFDLEENQIPLPLNWADCGDDCNDDGHQFFKLPEPESRPELQRATSSKSNARKSRRRQKKQFLDFNSHTQSESVDMDYDWGGLPDYSNWNHVDDINDDFFVDTHDHVTTDYDWIEVKNVIKKKSKSQLFECEFPVLNDKNLKEVCVEEEMRVHWEREQNKYKKRLVMRDNSEITRLVSGHRRKPQNKLYYVGGVDISFVKDTNYAVACLSIVSLPALELVYQDMNEVKLTQPYIPGFLAFREVPALMDLFIDLKEKAPQYTPDVVMVDGNGILHPRGFGVASHLGVLLSIPTIGVAKTLISAQGISDDMEHKEKKKSLKQAGDGFDLISKENGQVLGKCVRVHDAAPNPMYVSVGHMITLSSAVWIVLECSKFRIPEPIRRADLDSRDYIRNNKVFIK